MSTANDTTSKCCTKCGLTKLLTEFPLDKNSKDGRKPSCKVCLCLAAREYRKRPEVRERQRLYRLRPEVKARELAAWKVYRKRPDVRVRDLEYRREKAKQRGKIKTIYFVQATNGLIKIGTTENLEKRVKHLNAMSPIPLMLLAACRGNISEELDLHRRFAKYHAHGEWFYPERELLAFIDELKGVWKDAQED